MTQSPGPVVAIDQRNVSAAKVFLEGFPETSLFMLSNIRAFGPRLGESLYSGNLKGIEQDGELAAVFCVTRGGSLLAQTAGRTEYASEILRACAEEAIPIRGVLGEWQITSAIWNLLLETDAVTPTFVSKEVSYRLDLRPATHAAVLSPWVRMLSHDDHDQWAALSTEFQKETHLPAQGTRQERETSFLRSSGLGHWWGAFQQGRLVSMAAVIAQHEKLAQVGGVFTLPNQRRQGLSRAVMNTLIDDSTRIHWLDRLFLFTGEENVEARRLYESLGFESFGHFGLFFGDPKERQR